MSDQATIKAVQVDGDKLAEAFRRVTPFMAEGGSRPDLVGVYAESDAGTLQLTTSDGFRIAHLTVNLPFPEGKFLLEAKGCKDFSTRHYNGATIDVTPVDGSSLTIGEVKVGILNLSYFDYPSVVPENFETEVMVDPKAWIKVLRKYDHIYRAGIVYDPKGCIAYLAAEGGETVGHEPLPVQTFLGPEKRIAYSAEKLRRALTSCGANCTIQIGKPEEPTVFESDDYWHVLAPEKNFPKEVSLTGPEKDVLKLAREMIDAGLAGEVPIFAMSGGGKIYIELNPARTTSEVIVKEPILKE